MAHMSLDVAAYSESMAQTELTPSGSHIEAVALRTWRGLWIFP
jgi:hypothetical protein